jgi:hypothetical protein
VVDDRGEIGWRIVVCCFGSRGDAQPYLALALRLTRAGFHVCVMSNADHQPFFEGFGIEFVAVAEDAEASLQNNALAMESMAEFMAVLGDPKNLGIWGEYWPAFVKVIGTFKPDFFVCGTLAQYQGEYCKRILRVPMCTVTLQYLAERDDHVFFGMPFLPPFLGLNKPINWQFTHGFYEAELKTEALGRTLGVPLMHDALFNFEKLLVQWWRGPTNHELVCYAVTPAAAEVSGSTRRRSASSAAHSSCWRTHRRVQRRRRRRGSATRAHRRTSRRSSRRTASR